MEPVSDFTTVRAIFLRQRNLLMLSADFTPIFTDYYLHLHDIGERPAPNLDAMLKDYLAAMTLHLTARPWAETIAWTANLRAPRINIFATGSSNAENITGRIFTEDVREPDRNFLYSQTLHNGVDPRRSTIEVEGTDPLAWVEQYYKQSEQRPGKAFRLAEDHYCLLTAQPDFDKEWLDNLTRDEALNLLEKEDHNELETRRFRFYCGCNLEKIMPVLSAWKDKADQLFQGEAQIKVQCPRCAKKYIITPAELNDYL